MIHLEKINGEIVWDILKLKVSDSQKSFVAGNDISIIEAYTTCKEMIEEIMTQAGKLMGWN